MGNGALIVQGGLNLIVCFENMFLIELKQNFALKPIFNNTTRFAGYRKKRDYRVLVGKLHYVVTIIK